MGFFQDLKEDLSQAVTELMDEETAQETKQDTENVTDDTKEMEQSTVETFGELPEEELQAEPAVQAEEIPLQEEEAFTQEAEVPMQEEEIPVQEEEIPTMEEPENREEEASNEIVMDEESEAMMKDVLQEMQAVKEKHTKVEMNMSEDYSNEEALDETAIVTKGMTIKGDVISKGSMDVIGSIEGNIDILGKLNVTGAIKGNSKADEVFADAAKIVGEVKASGTVKIGASSVIIGNIQATSAVIAGAVKGDIDVQGPVILDTSAIVMGNIKSKSVQINNGAVIEGLCSQCYADVSPTSFFEEFK